MVFPLLGTVAHLANLQQNTEDLLDQLEDHLGQLVGVLVVRLVE